MNPYEEIKNSVSAFKADMESLKEEKTDLLTKLQSPADYFPADIELFKGRLSEIKKEQERRTESEEKALDELATAAVDRLYNSTDINPADIDFNLINMYQSGLLKGSELDRMYHRANDSTKAMLFRLISKDYDGRYLTEHNIINPQMFVEQTAKQLQSDISSIKRYMLPWWDNSNAWERNIETLSNSNNIENWVAVV